LDYSAAWREAPTVAALQRDSRDDAVSRATAGSAVASTDGDRSTAALGAHPSSPYRWTGKAGWARAGSGATTTSPGSQPN